MRKTRLDLSLDKISKLRSQQQKERHRSLQRKSFFKHGLSKLLQQKNQKQTKDFLKNSNLSRSKFSKNISQNDYLRNNKESQNKISYNSVNPDFQSKFVNRNTQFLQTMNHSSLNKNSEIGSNWGFATTDLSGRINPNQLEMSELISKKDPKESLQEFKLRLNGISLDQGNGLKEFRKNNQNNFGSGIETNEHRKPMSSILSHDQKYFQKTTQPENNLIKHTVKENLGNQMILNNHLSNNSENSNINNLTLQNMNLINSAISQQPVRNIQTSNFQNRENHILKSQTIQNEKLDKLRQRDQGQIKERGNVEIRQNRKINSLNRSYQHPINLNNDHIKALRRGTLQTPLFQKKHQNQLNNQKVQNRAMSMNFKGEQSLNSNHAISPTSLYNQSNFGVHPNQTYKFGDSNLSPHMKNINQHVMSSSRVNQETFSSREVHSLGQNVSSPNSNSPKLIQTIFSQNRQNNPSIQSHKSPLFSSFAQKQNTNESNNWNGQFDIYQNRKPNSAQFGTAMNQMGDHMSQYSVPALLSPDNRIKWNQNKNFSRKHVRVWDDLPGVKPCFDCGEDYGILRGPNEVILPGGPEQENPIDLSAPIIEPFSKSCLRKSSSKIHFYKQYKSFLNKITKGEKLDQDKREFLSKYSNDFWINPNDSSNKIIKDDRSRIIGESSKEKSLSNDRVELLKMKSKMLSQKSDVGLQQNRNKFDICLNNPQIPNSINILPSSGAYKNLQNKQINSSRKISYPPVKPQSQSTYHQAIESQLPSPPMTHLNLCLSGIKSANQLRPTVRLEHQNQMQTPQSCLNLEIKKGFKSLQSKTSQSDSKNKMSLQNMTSVKMANPYALSNNRSQRSIFGNKNLQGNISGKRDQIPFGSIHLANSPNGHFEAIQFSNSQRSSIQKNQSVQNQNGMRISNHNKTSEKKNLSINNNDLISKNGLQNYQNLLSVSNQNKKCESNKQSSQQSIIKRNTTFQQFTDPKSHFNQNNCSNQKIKSVVNLTPDSSIHRSFKRNFTTAQILHRTNNQIRNTQISNLTDNKESFAVSENPKDLNLKNCDISSARLLKQSISNSFNNQNRNKSKLAPANSFIKKKSDKTITWKDNQQVSQKVKISENSLINTPDSHMMMTPASERFQNNGIYEYSKSEKKNYDRMMSMDLGLSARKANRQNFFKKCGTQKFFHLLPHSNSDNAGFLQKIEDLKLQRIEGNSKHFTLNPNRVNYTVEDQQSTLIGQNLAPAVITEKTSRLNTASEVNIYSSENNHLTLCSKKSLVRLNHNQTEYFIQAVSSLKILFAIKQNKFINEAFWKIKLNKERNKRNSSKNRKKICDLNKKRISMTSNAMDNTFIQEHQKLEFYGVTTFGSGQKDEQSKTCSSQPNQFKFGSVITPRNTVNLTLNKNSDLHKISSIKPTDPSKKKLSTVFQEPEMELEHSDFISRNQNYISKTSPGYFSHPKKSNKAININSPFKQTKFLDYAFKGWKENSVKMEFISQTADELRLKKKALKALDIYAVKKSQKRGAKQFRNYQLKKKLFNRLRNFSKFTMTHSYLLRNENLQENSNFKTISSNYKSLKRHKPKKKKSKKSPTVSNLKKFIFRRQWKLRNRAFYILHKYSKKKLQKRQSKIKLKDAKGFVKVKIIKYFPDRTPRVELKNQNKDKELNNLENFNTKKLTMESFKKRKNQSLRMKNKKIRRGKEEIKTPQGSQWRLFKKKSNIRNNTSQMKSTVSARKTQRKFGVRTEIRKKRIEDLQKKYMSGPKFDQNQDYTIEF